MSSKEHLLHPLRRWELEDWISKSNVAFKPVTTTTTTKCDRKRVNYYRDDAGCISLKKRNKHHLRIGVLEVLHKPLSDLAVLNHLTPNQSSDANIKNVCHQKRLGESVPNVDHPWKCTRKCDSRLLRKDNYEQHLRRLHDIDVRLPEWNHLRQHHRQGIYICTVLCTGRFTRWDTYVQHLQKKHNIGLTVNEEAEDEIGMRLFSSVKLETYKKRWQVDADPDYLPM